MLRTACVLTFAAVLGVAAPAAATVPSESDKATARTLVAVGDEHFARGNYADALDAYRGADQIMHVPTTSILVAQTLVVLGRLLEAKTLLETFQDDVDDEEPVPFTVARADARELHRELDQRIPRLTLVVEPTPDEATLVTVDGRPAKLGVALRLDPGPHRVDVTTADGRRVTRRVTLAEGSAERLAIAAPPSLPDESSSPGAPLAWTGLTMLGAGAVVGGVLGGLSLKRAADAEDRCPTKRGCDATTRDLVDDSTTFAHVSTAGFVVAGVGAGLALTGLGIVLAEDDGSDVSAQLSLGSFGISGRF